MSRAFVRETDSNHAPADFPERVPSSQPNFVTRRGLQLIEDAIAQLELERESAKTDPVSVARINRDLRYWLQRKSSAKLIEPETTPAKVRFGVTVRLSIAGGAEHTYTLVGEDEANPAQGLISWTSPVAQALLGHEAGDEISLQGKAAEIVGMHTSS